jgi:hypothetical protein
MKHLSSGIGYYESLFAINKGELCRLNHQKTLPF